jgi:uncharacterized repeat protein (TIGR01451 family)
MPGTRRISTRLSLAAALLAAASATALLAPGSAVPAAGENANLGLTKSDSPDPVAVGDVLTYTIRVTNGGPAGATGVEVDDTLPANLTFVSVTASQGSCHRNGRHVLCDLGSIGFGTIGDVTTPTVTIKVRPRREGNITNTASVDSVENDPVAANNTATATTKVNAAPVTPPPTQCAGRDATLVGNGGDNHIVGTSGNDVVVARGGNDSILTFGGRDVICGGGGNDYAVSGGGADRVLGGFGNDRILGRAGSDVLAGNAGRDILRGGLGNDELRGGLGFDTCLGGAGTDTRSGCEVP